MLKPRRFLLTWGVCTLGWLGQSAIGQSSAQRLPFGFSAPVPAAPSNLPPCTPPTDPLNLALWRVATANGQPDLSCLNRFVGFERTPRSPEHPQDAFDLIAAQIRDAKSEVLLANMEWDTGPGTPGWTFAQAVRDLYAKVLADPDSYPQGMTVRLLLGGFPKDPNAYRINYLLYAIRDLRALGVPFDNQQIGWHLEAASYPYLPHSHVKLHVIDGQDVTAAGYNFSVWHLPTPEKGGHDLHDLGLRMSGPIAQQGVAIFDDLWRHSEQVACPPDLPAAKVIETCSFGPSDSPKHPASASAAVPSGEARAYLLYRRPGFAEADQGVLALLDAAQSEIDLMQADFGPNLQCWFAYLSPENCEQETFPVYMSAVLRAIERGVRVRVLTVDYGFGQAANRSGIALMRNEAKKRGLDDLFDARYTTVKMHTKAITVDGRMLAVGSMNFHFSSWGNWGLNEAVLATNDPQAVAEQTQSFEQMWQTQSRSVAPEWWQR